MKYVESEMGCKSMFIEVCSNFCMELYRTHALAVSVKEVNSREKPVLSCLGTPLPGHFKRYRDPVGRSQLSIVVMAMENANKIHEFLHGIASHGNVQVIF